MWRNCSKQYLTTWTTWTTFIMHILYITFDIINWYKIWYFRTIGKKGKIELTSFHTFALYFTINALTSNTLWCCCCIFLIITPQTCLFWNDLGQHSEILTRRFCLYSISFIRSLRDSVSYDGVDVNISTNRTKDYARLKRASKVSER